MEVRPGVSAPRGDSEPAPRDLAPGEKLGRYAILESVGRGAMGVVYAAYDSELDRKIALKVLNPNRTSPIAPARLVREAKAMARLSHPNVIAIHDVGMMEGRVFLAMEFLGGGTLRTWLDARPRAWRECLDLFIAAGRGLAAAHDAGLVHRDFKPDNVLLDKQQRPRVVDFGLARQAAAGDSDAREAAVEISQITESSREAGGNHLETLTRTGTLVGTPAYMAPEQFLGEPADERSDQFSFCIALYEALCGARPFAGDNVLALSLSVTTGQVRAIPKDRVVPAWIRRVIARGLQSKPAERYPSMAALIAALEDDPAVRRRRRLITGVVVGVVAATMLVAGMVVRRRRQELDRQIAAHLTQAAESTTLARTKAAGARELRERALAAFDGMERERGEAIWRQTLAQVPTAEATFDRATRAYETALVLDPSRVIIREQLAAVLEEHLLFAQTFRLADRARALETRLLADDADGSRRKRLHAPGTLVLALKPPGGPVALERYQRDATTGLRMPRPVKDFSPAAPVATLAAGSYRLVLGAAGPQALVYPFEIRPGERVVVEVTLPPAGAVPSGFVYVPAGAFWYGDADEQLRTQFLDTAPLHRRSTGAFLIARNETTFREWIEFLDGLPPVGRDRLSPDVSVSTRGSLRLRHGVGGWQLSFQPTTERYEARLGDPIVYQGRKLRARQDWLDFPATGMSPQDAQRYLDWLSSGRVPGARFCTELEWERAARGADDRVFPHGDELRADDANFDITYGRLPAAYGPDVVGSHPLSASPFDVQDLAGNALELALSVERKDEFVIRGGAYYFGAATARSTNRQPAPSTFRDVTAGLRVCASATHLNGSK